LRLLTGGAPATDSNYSDPELFDGIVRGDERVASALYRRLLPEVERALSGVLERRDGKQDELVRESFERMIVIVSRRRYAEACNLESWAGAVAAQVALARLRARLRRNTQPVALVAPGVGRSGVVPSGSERGAAQRRALEWLRVSVARLAPARAEVVVLHDLMRHPLAEIATLMRLSVAATQSRLVRAHKDLTLAWLEQGSLAESKAGSEGESSSKPAPLPDLEELFSVWRGQFRERARSSSIAPGGSRVLVRALRLVARRRRRIQQLSTAALGAAAILTALGVGFGIWFAQRRLSGDAERPRAESRVLLGAVQGEVSVSDRQGHAAGGYASLSEGYGLRTDEGTARLGFSSGAAVSVSDHSRLAILSTQETEVFFLGTGRVEVDLPDLALGGSFAIETPDTHLTSHAARFLISVDPIGNTSTHVEVRSGSVSVRYAGHDLELRAGQSWPSPISTVDSDSEGPIQKETEQ
jgi:DNA-directed RNA polymerase specialized sigma24 family protein